METTELFLLITSQEKWYAGIIMRINKEGETEYHNPNSANRIKKRFSDKKLSFKMIDIIFTHHGYELIGKWEKRTFVKKEHGEYWGRKDDNFLGETISTVHTDQLG